MPLIQRASIPASGYTTQRPINMSGQTEREQRLIGFTKMAPRQSLLRLSAVALTALAGCANQQYGGINYGDVTMPNGEHWIVAGGKDETNVTFEVTRPDGTKARYSAESANSSVVLAEMAKIQAQQLQLLGALLAKVPGP